MAYNQAVEVFRDLEYPKLQNEHYLDHGGTTIYAKTLLENFQRKMLSGLWGNPHSGSGPAAMSTNMVALTRKKTLKFFGADPEKFDLIFVQNSTAAIKLVMDGMRDLAEGTTTGDFKFVYHKDAHTSLVGVREVTKDHLCLKSDAEVDQWIARPHEIINDTPAGAPGKDKPCLFAYPGQSNFNGHRLPLSWPAKLRNSSRVELKNAYSLFDAAALAVTSSLGKVFHDHDGAPDFTCVSFYKIFGFPDLGALIVRKESGHVLLWRKYFGGGTVNMVTVMDSAWHRSKDSTLHEALEDGTLPIHNIMALGCAIDVHCELYGSMTSISRHVMYLAKCLYDGLQNLRYPNGAPLCIVYAETGNLYDNPDIQGPTIAFNVMKEDGTFIPYSEVDFLASKWGIYIRSGGLCNPGGIAYWLDLAPWQMSRAWSAGHRCGGVKNLNIINGKPTGVLRASLGAMSVQQDVDALLNFLEKTYIYGKDKLMAYGTGQVL